MIEASNLNLSIIEKLFESKHKFIFLIDKETKILDYNLYFEEFIKKFKSLKSIITHTHRESFLKEISSLNKENRIKK